MRVSIAGSGYVGTTIAACSAALGHEVVNIDVDEEIVETTNGGTPPIHEEGFRNSSQSTPERVAPGD